jgi:hypothetical protein
VRTKKQAIDEAYNAYMASVANLRIHEAKWKADWDAAPNPFLAWDQHKKNRPQRTEVIQKWIKARDFYNNLKERK